VDAVVVVVVVDVVVVDVVVVDVFVGGSRAPLAAPLRLASERRLAALLLLNTFEYIRLPVPLDTTHPAQVRYMVDNML